MNNFMSENQINSAQQLAESYERERVHARDIQAENGHKRKVGEATIELNAQTKRQNEILKAQLSEIQKSNELLVKQAADSAKTARWSLIVAVASLLVALLSLIVTLAK